MADFLSNLLLRSAVDQPTAAILRPRLPSLFEPLRGAEEIPMLSPDPVVQETYTRASEPPATVSLKNELPTGRSTITSELLPSQATNPSLAPPSMALDQVQETKQSAGQQIQAIKTVSSLEEPEVSVKTRSLIQEDHSLIADESRNMPRAESIPLRAQAAEENSPPTKLVKNLVEVNVRSLKEDSPLDKEVNSNKESSLPKPGAKPATVLKPILTASRAAQIQGFEPPQEQQRVARAVPLTDG